MPKPNDTLAVMRNVRYGCDDRGGVSLMFDTYVTESSAASHWLDTQQAAAVIKAAGVSDVSKLEGQTCWVTCDSVTITFVKVAKL